MTEIELQFDPPHHLIRASADLLMKQKPALPQWVHVAGWAALFLVSLAVFQGVLGTELDMSHAIAAAVPAVLVMLVILVTSKTTFAHFENMKREGAATSKRVSYRLHAKGFCAVTSNLKIESTWDAIDDILRGDGFTGLRLGARLVAIPEDALPMYLTPDTFLEQLRAWKNAQ